MLVIYGANIQTHCAGMCILTTSALVQKSRISVHPPSPISYETRSTITTCGERLKYAWKKTLCRATSLTKCKMSFFLIF